MAQPQISQQELARFSRVTVLLFNRVTVYSANHPYTKETLDQFHQVVELLLDSVSPIVLLLVHDQLSIDDEPLDPRINVLRVLAKNHHVHFLRMLYGAGRSRDVLDGPDAGVEVEALPQERKKRPLAIAAL